MVFSSTIAVPSILGVRDCSVETAFGSAMFGESGDETPSTYCFVEAARIFGLAEILETSDAENACLFAGNAETELREVAPFIAKLTPDMALTRKLLSGDSMDDPPWMMWPRFATTFFRSARSLRDLRNHFRHFTQLRDEKTNRMNYFRFFAPEVMRHVVGHMDEAMLSRFARDIDMFIIPTSHEEAMVLRPHAPAPVASC